MTKKHKSDEHIDIENAVDTEAVGTAEPLDLPTEDELGEADADWQAKLEAALAQVEDYKSALQRERADFSNYKKRIERETSEAQGKIAGDTIKRFLPIFDDLDRAIQTFPAEWQDSDWFKGFNLIGKKFADMLDNYGIQAINPLGEPFDHNFHEAIGSDDSADYPSGTVIDVLQKGYALGDKCIRPAMVRVAN